MNKRPMRKSSSIGGFAIDDLVDVGDAVQKVNCAEVSFGHEPLAPFVFDEFPIDSRVPSITEHEKRLP